MSSPVPGCPSTEDRLTEICPFGKDKRPPGSARRPSQGGGAGLPETEPHAEAQDARSLHLQHLIGAGPAEDALALQDVGLVEDVEDVGSDREVEVAEGEFLLQPQ